jgi:hypothetical protein
LALAAAKVERILAARELRSTSGTGRRHPTFARFMQHGSAQRVCVCASVYGFTMMLSLSGAQKFFRGESFRVWCVRAIEKDPPREIISQCNSIRAAHPKRHGHDRLKGNPLPAVRCIIPTPTTLDGSAPACCFAACCNAVNIRTRSS